MSPATASSSATDDLAAWCAASLRARVEPAREFFQREAAELARVARAMADRFARGGRILAFGSASSATDAMHVAVEFTHPVLVGKRALPALDVSLDPCALVRALARPEDIVIAFDPPCGDARVDAALDAARIAGAMTIALPSRSRAHGNHDAMHYALGAPRCDEHRLQELIEVVGHVLYESVHVFLEHRTSARHEHLGESAFLYPFLTSSARDANAIERDGVILERDVADSIRAKAREGEAIRERLATNENEAIAAAIATLATVAKNDGTLLCFGNGGSATDAIDFALDCASEAGGLAPLRAISLAHEPATLTALANDVGREAMFLRQIVAQARPGDAVVAFSTSGGSTNVIAALEEARKRKLTTVALLGYDGGEIARRSLADRIVVVRSDFVPRVQEAQAAVYHTIRAGIARVLGRLEAEATP